MISVRFQGKPFNIIVIQVYDLTSNAAEAEVEQSYEDLQDLLELTTKKDVLFIIGDWNAKVGSQETPGVTGKFGLRVQNEAGQRLTEFCLTLRTSLAVQWFRLHASTAEDAGSVRGRGDKDPTWHGQRYMQNNSAITS